VRTLNESQRSHDVGLIERIASGDAAALTEFYGRYASILYGIAVKILNDSREAEDALQDGFVFIWRKAGTYQPELSSPFSWAVMIVRNKAIDRIRARQRAERVAERVALEKSGGIEFDDDSAEEPALRELRKNARDAVAHLPGDQREALELAFLGGFTHDEVAARLEIPLGTVKARIRRGLLRMRTLISTRHD
jgi:RNA polymerase sigma-70 factor, ECF subfamily